MQAPKRRTIAEQYSAADMYPTRPGQSARDIQRAVETLFPSQPFATHGSVCADLLLDKIVRSGKQTFTNRDRDIIITDVLAERTSTMVGSILVYSRNVKTAYGTGRREPKPLHEQRAGFKRNLYASWRTALTALQIAQAGQTGQSGATSSGAESAAEPSVQVAEGQAHQTEPSPYAGAYAYAEPEPEPEPVSVQVVEPTCPLRAHHQWSVKVARLMEERGKDWSYRPTIDGIALIAAGCDPAAVRDSCLMDYPDDLRAELGVNEPVLVDDVLDYLTKAASARVDQRGVRRPVCLALVGPAGTGKTTLTEALADALETDYYDLSMSAGTPLSAFYGREGLQGDVRTSQFERWAINGGLHLFDEMDCSEPNLLKIVNKALANRCYTNPLTGETIKLAEDAVAVAAMNTLGVGIQTEYSAAEQLDFSTIDRFRAGRVRVQRDYDKETQIVEAQIAVIEASR